MKYNDILKVLIEGEGFISKHYKGWLIRYNENAPVYAKYKASQYGVNISNSTYEELKKQIDRKMEERNEI